MAAAIPKGVADMALYELGGVAVNHVENDVQHASDQGYQARVAGKFPPRLQSFCARKRETHLSAR